MASISEEEEEDGIVCGGGRGWIMHYLLGDEDAIEVDQLYCEFVSSCEPLAKINGRARATPVS